ncbi:MAG: LysM-repeat proteins and domain [Caldanaerobacter subterraneus]|jgi:spore germination cell wall hydrolase CwlJ-like protein|uniref:LysM-repeat proteins and domains n=2 Tax=Caldanaerobacter subterraneus TaxID=911092 RepID=Q8RB08_CALS4|nr:MULTISPECIES: LysM peptidoglycan-binding domain-containing protein [Caldanaerobacter]AAM24273.1 LysM-repeat proteins and domains [Caldanaerobacter subterraneus subsp. tengcongensis MB4]KUK08741.1 MAG: LysM-repeat proteins and domain [Caldanaerobacter subterraneus]MCS3916199.1 spore germination cell wall hydrolase CwlJ-like protein [Caldanaerobacter subterraneus subsp. tengcongensis MB4]MDI3518747.1 N-acetylmuramoyl-L-alanine amidase [Caldanaerobacter sp.]TCO63858.1 LysM domain-containing pr
MSKVHLKVKPLIALIIGGLFLFQAAFAATYTVKPGDTLWGISQKYGITYTKLMALNGLQTTTIYPGQVLQVPGNDNTYVVQKGDSLYLIAKKYGITVDALKAANDYKSDIIYPGQVFIIPKPVNSSSRTYNDVSRGYVQRSVIPYTPEEFDLLARLVTAEADGEPYQAKVAVAAVVINRVKSGIFPNTIKDVIYQVDAWGNYQFTPVLNGWINRPASTDAIAAARDALNGIDPTNGALYYFDQSSTNAWLWSLPIAARIGNMVFCYGK